MLTVFYGCTNTFEERLFQFTYEVIIEPTNGKKLELWIPVPKSNVVQIVSNMKFNLGDLSYQVNEEKVHGNKYLYIHEENGISDTTKLTMTFSILRKEHGNIKIENVQPGKYLGSYSTVPTGTVFTSLIDEQKLSKNNMKGVYDFVLSGMHYGKPKSIDDQYYKEPWLTDGEVYGTKGVNRDEVVSLYQKAITEQSNYTFGNGNSVYACDIGVGNCTDYHSYFMSLGRTLGVPIRFHMGFPIPSGSKGTVGGYHCWADYYIEGEGWYPVDISEGDKDPQRKDYYFGTLDNNRVEMILGRDIKLEGYEMETTNLFIYPIMEINDQTSSAFSKSFQYKEI